MAHVLLSQDILEYIPQKLYLLYSLLLSHFLKRGTTLKRGILNCEVIKVWDQMIFFLNDASRVSLYTVGHVRAFVASI